MTKTTKKTFTRDDIQAIVAEVVAAVTGTNEGFIIVKKQNTSEQLFFSDHRPVDGIDVFGHSTKKIDRLVDEAYHYDTFAEAFNDLIDLIADDKEELLNDTITGLGIYSIADDAIVFDMKVSHTDSADLNA